MAQHTEEIRKSIVEKKTYTIAPCIKCNSDDIELTNYEDNFGCISGGKCKHCGAKHNENWGEHKYQAAEIWNGANDPSKLIEHQQAIVLKANNRIKELKAIVKQRKVKPKTKLIK